MPVPLVFFAATAIVRAFVAAMLAGEVRLLPLPPQPAQREREREQAKSDRRRRAHQYVRSWGCHFVIVTGRQSSCGRPSIQRTIVCFEVVLVVTLGIVVRPRVRAAALLPREAGDDHAVRKLEQEPELERLGQVVIEHVALVFDDYVLVALPEAGDDLRLLLHLLLAAEDAEVLVHRLGELVADPPRPLARCPGRAAPSARARRLRLPSSAR